MIEIVYSLANAKKQGIQTIMPEDLRVLSADELDVLLISLEGEKTQYRKNYRRWNDKFVMTKYEYENYVHILDVWIDEVNDELVKRAVER